MERHDEEVLGVERPVVVPGAGQKAAGWALRVFGLLSLFGGALGVTLALVFMMMGWSRPTQMNMDPCWGYPLMALVSFGVMATGTAMGVFGMMVAGSYGSLEGARFAKWTLAVLLRDLGLMSGTILLVSSVAGAATFLDWTLLGLLTPGVGMLLLGRYGGRLMKRVRGDR